jgi:hypothetical protein
MAYNLDNYARAACFLFSFLLLSLFNIFMGFFMRVYVNDFGLQYNVFII